MLRMLNQGRIRSIRENPHEVKRLRFQNPRACKLSNILKLQVGSVFLPYDVLITGDFNTERADTGGSVTLDNLEVDNDWECVSRGHQRGEVRPLLRDAGTQ
ncbi:MAG: hypothetical protein IH899_09485 [Planctomycetes bacterium]|nr:hypothetical protein [Planctomycetota bacterium]